MGNIIQSKTDNKYIRYDFHMVESRCSQLTKKVCLSEVLAK